MGEIRNIKLAFQCDQDLSKMTKCSLGYYCSVCDKTVIDFRKSEMSDLKKVTISNTSTCGLFKKSQIQIEPKFGSFNRFFKSALIAIGLGTISTQLIAQVKKIKVSSHEKKQIYNNGGVFGEVAMQEINPDFKNGGTSEMYKFLKSNLNFQGDTTKGRVFVKFAVDTSGKTSKITIMKGLSPIIDKEVIRVVELLEFNPARSYGKKVFSNYYMPIKVNLNEDK